MKVWTETLIKTWTNAICKTTLKRILTTQQGFVKKRIHLPLPVVDTKPNWPNKTTTIHFDENFTSGSEPSCRTFRASIRSRPGWKFALESLLPTGFINCLQLWTLLLLASVQQFYDPSGWLLDLIQINSPISLNRSLGLGYNFVSPNKLAQIVGRMSGRSF